MRTKILLELLVATGCTITGARLWRGDAEASPAAPDGIGGDRSQRQSPPPPADADALDPSHARERTGTDRGALAGSGGDASSDGSAAASLSKEARPRTPRRPRAPAESTAALPSLSAPESPRVSEELARVALRYVGKDAGAYAMWVDAIDDPAMPAEARSDLIEDLNDEGYSDPDATTAADLPLILERIRIIERLAPDAWDDVNAAAFAEAYKDLVNMLVRLRGAGAGRD